METLSKVGWVAVLLLVGLLASSLAVAQKDDQGEVLMQAATHKQLVEGLLEEAIQIYKRIVQEYGSNRPLAAKALVQMGHCYEKLGKEEARKAYERVLRDYADQNEAAAQARRRLAALSGSAVSSSSEMVARRVWTPGPEVSVLSGSLSPDGRYLSFVDLTTGDLALRDLVTGKMHRLTNEGSSTELGNSAISPDGQQIAYNAIGKDGSGELRLIRLNGSAPRVLYSSKEGFPYLANWSPDGRYILASLVIVGVTYTFQIAQISVADGSVRVLKSLDWFPTALKYSPDGRYIAYDFPQQPESGNRDIFLLAADGNREIRLVEHPADDELLGWTPDGTHVLFASDRSGSMSAWVIRVVEGRAQGSPELVKSDIGEMAPIGFTRSGAFYYGLAIGTSDVYTAQFDPAEGKVLTQPQNASQRFVGWNSTPAWSLDGQYLAYISRNRHWLYRGRPEIITIRSLKTGQERDLSPNLSFIEGPMRWSPDGRSLLVSGKDWRVRHGLFSVDAQTGEVTRMVLSDDAPAAMPAWLPDGKRLLYGERRREAGTTTDTILIRDFETGRGTELFRAAPGVRIANIALSPDGRQVALTVLEEETKSSVLKVLPVAGGQASELVRAKHPETIVGLGESLSWSADSRYIIFGRARATSQERKTELLAISSRGGEPHDLGLAMDFVRYGHVSFHPDGRRLAFTSAGKDKVEIWVMENFLPTLKAAK